MVVCREDASTGSLKYKISSLVFKFRSKELSTGAKSSVTKLNTRYPGNSSVVAINELLLTSLRELLYNLM